MTVGSKSSVAYKSLLSEAHVIEQIVVPTRHGANKYLIVQSYSESRKRKRDITDIDEWEARL